jgi:ribonuclease III
VAPQPDLDELQRKLGYRFENPDLLVTALTHRSFANENKKLGRKDNEKLEFLGDAVLDLVVGHLVMRLHPDLREGQLSVTRSRVVSEAGLAEVAANALDLGSYLYLGKGENRSGGREKPSLIADGFEAVMAAIYLDAGYQAAWDTIDRLLTPVIERINVTTFADHKTRLQEQLQALLHTTPVYKVVAEHGPDHDKLCEVVVFIHDREWKRSVGSSKKHAEQNAAADALWKLNCTSNEELRAEFGDMMVADPSAPGSGDNS